MGVRGRYIRFAHGVYLRVRVRRAGPDADHAAGDTHASNRFVSYETLKQASSHRAPALTSVLGSSSTDAPHSHHLGESYRTRPIRSDLIAGQLTRLRPSRDRLQKE